MRKQIIKMAYKMPPQENWNEFRDPEQRNPNYITDEHYQRLQDAKFTHGMGLLEHGADVAVRALEMAQKHGLKYYVRDEVNWTNILHKDFYYLNAENYKRYMQYDSFAGVYIYDEPNAAKYGELGAMVQGYYDFFRGKGEPLVNLLPTYASHVEQLGADTYEEYIRKYIETVPTDYVMYDHYPFMTNAEGGDILRSDYLYNASVVATLCKEYGKELRTFVQSCVLNKGNYPTTSEMLEFQIHTNLAHGSHAIVYYYYWGDMNGYKECGDRHGIVDGQGNPQELYYGVQRIHNELEAYEEKLLECRWEKTMYIKGRKAHLNQTEFARFTCEDKECPFRSEYDCIVGVFDYKGKKAYYVVNYTNPRLNLTNRLNFKLEGKYEVWCGGNKTEADERLDIVVHCGGGAFLLPKE